MKYALFTSIPLIGHVNPLLRQAEELQRRGWRVALATTSNMAPHVAVESPEVPFVDLGPMGEAAAPLHRALERASADRTFAWGTLGIVRGVMPLWPVMFDGLSTAMAGDRPDVVVADLFTAAGVCAADAARVPVVIHNPDLLAAISVTLLPPADHLPFLFSGRSRRQVGAGQRAVGPVVRRVAAAVASMTVGRDLNRQRRRRGLPRVDIHERLRGRPILVMGAFGLEYERPLPPNVVMAGAMLPPEIPPLATDMDRWLRDGPAVAYCNLGTVVAAPAGLLERMAAAFNADRDLRVLWVLRPRERWPRVEAHVRLIEWGPPPISVLAHENVRAFVSHCGINSVHESIVAGTPIVGVPMFADQRDMAARVQDAGAGVWLDKHRVTPAALAAAVQRVTGERTFADALPPLQRAIEAAGGVTRAADVIVAAAEGKAPREKSR